MAFCGDEADGGAKIWYVQIINLCVGKEIKLEALLLGTGFNGGCCIIQIAL